MILVHGGNEGEKFKMKTSNPLFGVVVNCLWAPIREKPNNESSIICEIGCLSEVEVIRNKEIDVFYYIMTPSGDEGYILKEYIALRI